MSSRNATREDFEHVIAAMKKGLVDPLNYITHRVQFNEVKEQFESWLKPETDSNRRIYGGGTLNKLPPPPQDE